jgi:hypothetical protein
MWRRTGQQADAEFKRRHVETGVEKGIILYSCEILIMSKVSPDSQRCLVCMHKDSWEIFLIVFSEGKGEEDGTPFSFK